MATPPVTPVPSFLPHAPANAFEWTERLVWGPLRIMLIGVIIAFMELIGLRLLRLLNRRLRIVRSLFVMYPANRKYAAKIVLPALFRRYREGRLAPCMVLIQGGRLTLVLGTTVGEQELRRSDEEVRRLHALAESYRRDLHVPEITYSGLMPSLMVRAGIDRDPTEPEVTAQIVTRAAQRVRERCAQQGRWRIVVLGGAGAIGSRVVARLRAEGADVFAIDPRLGPSRIESSWRDRPLLVINAAHRKALRSHVDDLWRGVVYLNEVYPEPGPRELADLEARGVSAWHVVGVAARSIPPFPGAYAGAIPCCAAIDPDREVPIVRELTSRSSPGRNGAHGSLASQPTSTRPPEEQQEGR